MAIELFERRQKSACMVEEKELVRRIAAGDRKAIATVHDRHAAGCAQQLLHRLPSFETGYSTSDVRTRP